MVSVVIEAGLRDLENMVEEVGSDGCVREEVAAEEGGVGGLEGDAQWRRQDCVNLQVEGGG
jgi:hypothetical protein